MKEFNLEEAIQGKPVCTRDGHKARIICFDCKNDFPIVALIDNDGNECVINYSTEGKFMNGDDDNLDLMVVGEKKEGWVNLYRSVNGIYLGNNLYDTKEQAIKEGTGGIGGVIGYVYTSKIEWEE